MDIALLGFGTVGAGVYELIRNRTDMRITRVLLRRQMTLPDAIVTQDFADILSDSTIGTVVETIGGLHPAYEYVKAAMEAGKHVVTANKALMAAYYDELLSVAKAQGVCLRCTAAVGGGLGWLSELERLRRVEDIREVGGIMNGTCNYILHAMDKLELSYSQALSQAQALGYAEADPSADVEGGDTRSKLILSCNIGFGISLDADGIPAAGIQNIRKEDVDRFKAHALVCKLTAKGRISGGICSAYVQPSLYPADALEAQVPANYNLTTLQGSISGLKSFYGQGAGRYPTASNVVQDCTDLLSGKGFYCSCAGKVPVSNPEEYRYYVRAEADAWLDACAADRWDGAVITGPVSVDSMHRWLARHPEAFVAALPKEA